MMRTSVSFCAYQLLYLALAVAASICCNKALWCRTNVTWTKSTTRQHTCTNGQSQRSVTGCFGGIFWPGWFFAFDWRSPNLGAAATCQQLLCARLEGTLRWLSLHWAIPDCRCFPARLGNARPTHQPADHGAGVGRRMGFIQTCQSAAAGVETDADWRHSARSRTNRQESGKLTVGDDAELQYNMLGVIIIGAVSDYNRSDQNESAVKHPPDVDGRWQQH